MKLSTTLGDFYVGRLGFYECWGLQFKSVITVNTPKSGYRHTCPCDPQRETEAGEKLEDGVLQIAVQQNFKISCMHCMRGLKGIKEKA